MRLEPLDILPVLADGVSGYSARLPGGDHRLHFAAGRECAARALTALGMRPVVIERGQAGEPLWPAGVTGSITHKGEYVAAAVARTSDVVSLGIDAEEIVDEARAARIAPLVMLPEESAVGGDHLSPALRVTLLFSIKEAVFKCLYPLVQKRFYYEAAAVTAVDVDRGTFDVRLLRRLSIQYEDGRSLTGRWASAQKLVFASMTILPDRQPGS